MRLTVWTWTGLESTGLGLDWTQAMKEWMGDLKGIQKHQNRRNLIPRVLSVASRKNPGCGWSRGNICDNKLCSGGRSSTKFWPLDDEILSGVGRKFLLHNGA